MSRGIGWQSARSPVQCSTRSDIRMTRRRAWGPAVFAADEAPHGPVSARGEGKRRRLRPAPDWPFRRELDMSPRTIECEGNLERFLAPRGDSRSLGWSGY